MTTSPTRLLAERDCASQQVRIGHGGHDVHPLTAGLDRQAIFADPPVLPRIGIQCLMARVRSSIANYQRLCMRVPTSLAGVRLSS